jgi:hypothetical protein
MKKYIFCLYLAIVILAIFTNCKKCEDPVGTPQNYLLDGLDANTKLPVSDTTNAFAYITGEIDGTPFSLVDEKDKISFLDYASAFFIRPFSWDSSYFTKNGVSSSWYFQTKLDSSQYWRVNFDLPSFRPKNTGEFNRYKMDLSTIGKVYKFGSSGVQTSNPNFTISDAEIDIIRQDKYILNGTPTPDVRLVSTISTRVSQANSFLKLVSIVKHPNVVNSYYLYELHYEFECNFNNGSRDIRLSKGKAKVWVRDIIY